MTLMEKVLQAAEPHIKGKGLTVVDGVIGFNFVGVQLSNGRTHFIYLMREAIPSGDDIFPYGEAMIGMDAWEVAQWALTGTEDLQRSIGVAALNAASPAFWFSSCGSLTIGSPHSGFCGFCTILHIFICLPAFWGG